MNKQEIGKAIEILSSFDGTTDQGLQRAVEMAVPLLQRELKALTQQLNNGWIPVSERLPEEEGYYLVYDENHQIIIEWRYTDKDTEWDNPYFATDYNVLAWQSLPESYKGENYD